MQARSQVDLPILDKTPPQITTRQIDLPPDVKSTAEYSKGQQHRFYLKRTWAKNGLNVNWILLNPSSASETTNDRTNVKTLDWTRDWDFDGRKASSVTITNLFSYRATLPLIMQSYYKRLSHDQRELVLKVNRQWLLSTARKADLIICAWGGGGKFLDEAGWVESMLHNQCAGRKLIVALGTNKDGSPVHPLYYQIKSFQETQSFIT